MKPRPKIPRPEDEPTLKVPQIMEIYGISETAAYDAIRRGDIPSLRIGRRVVCPTAAIRRHLGIDDGPEEAEAS
jgi:predicted DNA-binding transcriptional regulator AlpA